jgi:uncharacterized protein
MQVFWGVTSSRVLWTGCDLMETRLPDRLRETEGRLLGRVLLFSRYLRNRGFKVFSSGVLGALSGLEQLDVLRREDFFTVLRMNMAATDMEWRLFPELFRAFWEGEDRKEERAKGSPGDEPPLRRELLEDYLAPEEAGDRRVEGREKEFMEGVAYSPVSMVETKDLSCFHVGDVPVARLLLKSMMSPFRLSPSRRFRRSRRVGDIDFRRVMKMALRSDGIPMALFFKRRRKRLKRLVLIADVSGSMDCYARFVMPFILGLKGVGSKAEVFVFSTSLSRITPIIRRHSVEGAIEAIAREVPEWSGGTRIGHSIGQFNEEHGKRYLNKRTVAVILSDGWDLGAKNRLKKEMGILSEAVHSVIWLNPLVGDPEGIPLSRAMEMVRSSVDYLLPANSLGSLKRVARTLSRVMGQ